MANKNNRFANYGAFLIDRKIIPPPPSIVEETHQHSAEAIGFGAGENDWLGAEAYVFPLR